MMPQFNMGCCGDTESLNNQVDPKRYSMILMGRLSRLKEGVDSCGDSATKAQAQARWDTLNKKVQQAEAKIVNGQPLSTHELSQMSKQENHIQLLLYGHPMYDPLKAAQLLTIVNEARTKPANFVTDLEQDLKRFENDNIINVGGKRYETIEGKKAWTNAIDFLKKATAQPALASNIELGRCAFQHCRDMKRSGTVSHEGSNKIGSQQRVKRYVAYSGLIGQIITEGSSTQRQFVKMMIVNDGLADKQDRQELFNPKYKSGGGYLLGQLGTLCLVEDIL